MPTLYVENVPDDIYEALRARARDSRTSISASVITLLKEAVPTKAELEKRKGLLRKAEALRARSSPAPGPFLSAEEMQRQDRER